MKFKVGSKVCVKNVYCGGNFDNGDVVTIAQIGSEDESDCYGAISPHDGRMWYLCEDEVCAATNADYIRAMTDRELAEFLSNLDMRHCINCPAYMTCESGLPFESCVICLYEWLQQPFEKD